MADATINARESQGRLLVTLSGDWTLARLPVPLAGLERKLSDFSTAHVDWNLQSISRLDSVGANLLWRAWGRRWPDSLEASPQHLTVLKRSEGIPREHVLVSA